MKKYTFNGDAKLEKSLIEAGILVPVYDEDTPGKEKVVPEKFLYCGTFDRDSISVGYTVYKNAVSVNVYETHSKGVRAHNKTLYAQNFYKYKDLALTAIEGVLRGTGEVEDLIFKLKDLKEEEHKNNG